MTRQIDIMKKDIVITCKQCKQQFVWTKDEQEFYEKKGLQPPIYCMICRSVLKTAKEDKFRGKIKTSEEE